MCRKGAFVVLLAALAAQAAPAATVWSWNGADGDPGFVSTWPGGDPTSYYDPNEQVLRVGYATRDGINDYAVYYKDLGFQLNDFVFTVEYTTHDLGYGVEPGFGDNSVPKQSSPPYYPYAAVEGRIYDGPAGNLTYLVAYDYGDFPLYDKFLSTSHPQEDERYRLTLRRAGTQVDGDLELWDGTGWSLLGHQGPFDLPGLTEPFRYVRFEQVGYGEWGELWVHSMSVVPEPATLLLSALGAMLIARRRR